MNPLWLILGILAIAPAATAVPDGVTLVSGGLNGTWTLFHDSSPSPTCALGWEASLGENEIYHSDFSEDVEPCVSRWLVHCSADSVSYRGAWTSDDPTDYLWNFSFVMLEVSVLVVFDGPARIHIASDSQGVLQNDTHHVIVTPSGGQTEALLGPTPGGAVVRDLAAGTYAITMAVDVIEHHTHHEYQGNLRVWWEVTSGVTARTTSWAGVKALYR